MRKGDDPVLKSLALAVTLSALFAGVTMAQTAANPEECMNSTFALAHASEVKKLSEDEADKVEGLLVKMGDMCDANQYAEAMAVAEDLKGMIEKH
jgi:hypothetical protein